MSISKASANFPTVSSKQVLSIDNNSSLNKTLLIKLNKNKKTHKPKLMSFNILKWGVIRESNSCILVPQTSVLTTSPMAPFPKYKNILTTKSHFDK